MPNHVYTRIVISNPTKKQKEILKKIEKAEGLCRHYKPFPKELDGISNGNTTINGKKVRNWREVDGKSVAISEKELKELKEKYGATNWYDWCLNNWDTKWGCYDLEIEDDVIAFTSAWSPIGDNIIRMFAKDFPSFSYSWEEEQGYGSEMDYEGGECIMQSDYDCPEWEEIEEVETEENISYTITKLLYEHPNYDDGVGYYADWSNDFLGRTLEEAKESLGIKLKIVK
mgnify:CR=1 FL=1|tara:strand:+ start:245 stop:928 length:684 start_codon:yes stop_codon:yes gene_type:complete